jgi:hypothetical protein
MASLITPSKVAAIAANTYELSKAEADRAVKKTEDELGIVTADIIRHGPDRIIEAILARHAEHGLGKAAKSGTAARGSSKKPAGARR